MAVKIGITGPVGSIKAEALGKIIDMLKKPGQEHTGRTCNRDYGAGKIERLFYP